MKYKLLAVLATFTKSNRKRLAPNVGWVDTGQFTRKPWVAPYRHPPLWNRNITSPSKDQTP
jgi:hypothetical protein